MEPLVWTENATHMKNDATSLFHPKRQSQIFILQYKNLQPRVRNLDG